MNVLRILGILLLVAVTPLVFALLVLVLWLVLGAALGVNSG